MDSVRWRFKDWPDDRYIICVLIAYRPTDPFVDSWFITEIETDQRRIGYPGKAKAIGRALCRGLTNAVITARVENGPAENEPLQLDLGSILNAE
jgi:hypothetical protein